MKKLLFLLTLIVLTNIVLTNIVNAQFSKPSGAVSIPTYSFFRIPADSSIVIFQGPSLYNIFKMGWDSTKSTGYTSRKRLDTELFKKISKTAGGSSKFQMADGSLRDTVYEKHIPAGTISQYWRGDKTWQAFPSGMVWPTGAGIAVYTGSSSWGTSITDQSSHWNDAYDDRMKWSGTSTGLSASSGRSALGLNGWATANNDTPTLTVSGGAASWDTNSGLNRKITLTGNVTITLSNVATNGMSGTITVYNDATPRVLTFSGYTNIINPAVRSGANQITTSGGSKKDQFSWYWNGTELSWTGGFDFQ